MFPKVLLFVYAIIAISFPVEMVMCSATQNCAGSTTGTATRNECCMNNLAPSGIAYSARGVCFPCPIGKFSSVYGLAC